MEYTKERLFNCLDKFNLDNIPTEEIVEEIDVDMIPIITELNEKNWITYGCCSGHLERIKQVGTYNAYICFSNMLNTDPPTDPPRVTRKMKGSYNWIGNKKKSVEENEKERQQLMVDLLEWAKSLPVNNDLSGYYKEKEKIELMKNSLRELGFVI